MTENPDEPQRSKRPPPTIELEAAPASGWRRWTQAWRAKANSWSFGGFQRPVVSPSLLPLLTALGGVAVTLAVIAMLWWSGLAQQWQAPSVSSKATDDLVARLGRIEAQLSSRQPPAADPAVASRVAAVEQSLEALRQSSQQMREAMQRQADAVTASLNEIKSAPRAAPPPAPAPSVDLSPLNARIAELEQSIRALTTAQRTEPAPLDPAVARMLVANQLEAALRGGEPYAAALAAAKQSGNAAALAPLDAFAATGLPDDAALARELIALLPQLEPKPAPQAQPSGLLERLEASASRLVRVRPIDGVSGDPASVVQRIAAAAKRNDVAAARRELDRLDAAQRGPADGWIRRYDAREAARKASLGFATEALVALPRR